jgi:hypothetical protein
MIWKLVGRLKGLAVDWTPASKLEGLREWHRRALPFIRTKDFATSLADFGVAWANRRSAAGQTLDAVVREALSGRAPRAAGLFDDEPTRRLVTVCAALQSWTDPEPFFLGCRDAGRFVGVSHTLAARLLKVLVGLGVLESVRPGEVRVGGHAGAYRFRGER